MNIKFKAIKLHNFMSYQEETIQLDRHGFILVSGVNNNPADNAASNGTGKSSLFSAISWALTGLTVSGSKDVANIYLDGITSVELEFSLDNDEYIITRTKNPSNLKLFVNGENKSGKGIRDTEKILSEYLPDLTTTLLNSVIILGQGLPQKFTNNTPSGRKEVLEKLSNSDFMITDLKTRVASRHTQLANELKQAELSLVDALARQEMLTTQIQSTQSALDQYTNEHYHDLQQKHAEIKRTEADLLLKKADITTKIETTTNLIAQINSLLSAEALKYEEGKANLSLQDTTDINTEITTLQINIGTLAKEIKTLDSITDVCPTCGQKLPNVTKIDTSDKKTQLVQLSQELKNAQDKLKEIVNSNTQCITEYQVQYNNSIQDYNNTIQQLNHDLTLFKSQQHDTETRLNQTQRDMQKLNFDIQNFTSKQAELQELIQNYKIDLNNLQTKILYYNNNITTLNSHLEINAKMTTILTRDFRGYLISNVIDYIASQAKQYALEIFGTTNLIFELEGNNINIKYDSKDYEVLSGGEKQKIDVIIQFALRDMLCTYLNFSSNILVLDEITDSLDIIGSQKMFNLIAKKLNDVEAIFIISHHQDDFDIPYDDQINIVKGTDRISKIIQ